MSGQLSLAPAFSAERASPEIDLLVEIWLGAAPADAVLDTPDHEGCVDWKTPGYDAKIAATRGVRDRAERRRIRAGYPDEHFGAVRPFSSRLRTALELMPAPEAGWTFALSRHPDGRTWTATVRRPDRPEAFEGSCPDEAEGALAAFKAILAARCAAH